MNYLIHTSLLLAACFLYYRFLLRSETYFRLNRWILLGCLALSFSLPLITIPAEWSLRKSASSPIANITASISSASSTQDATQSNSTISNPDVEGSTDEALSTALATEVASQSIPKSKGASSNQESASDSMNWLKVLFWVYVSGLLVFGLHFIIQFGALLLKMLRYPGDDLGDFRLVELDENIAPYSFWNRIFLNPAQYDPDTFHQIVEHEQIHINQKHSFDILVAELLIVVQWCNPFAWWYRAAIEHNLEFLTDAMMLKQGADPVQYQLSLVQVASPNQPQGLTSNYNQSFLEKRITMMKTKHSSNRSAWKYLALLPILAFSVLQLNAISPISAVNAPITQAVSDDQAEPTPTPTPTPTSSSNVSIASSTITAPATTKEEVKETPAPLVKTEIAEPSQSSEIDVHSYNTANDRARSWTATLKGGDICFHFMVKDYNYMSTHNECISKKELGQLPNAQMGEFELDRYAGKMFFKGMFEGDTGIGTFSFEPSQALKNLLKKEGYGTYREEKLIHFFYADFTPEYLRFIQSEGYNPDKEDLFKLVLFFDNQAEIEQRLANLKKRGFSKPSLNRLIELQIHNISEDYINELASIGFDNLDLSELVKAKIHGVSATFMEEMKQAGFERLSFEQAKKMSIHNVSLNYVNRLKAMGFQDLTPENVTNAKIHNVNAEELADLKRAGLNDIDLHMAKQLAIHNVTPEYVFELAHIGYENLTPKEVVQAKIHGVNGRQIAALKALGYENISLRDAKQLAIHNVDSYYISSLMELNLGTMSLKDLRNAKIHGVTANFIRQHREKGDHLDDFIDLKIKDRY